MNYEVQSIFLIGLLSYQIHDAKLPFLVVVVFYNIREVKLTVSESGNNIILERISILEKPQEYLVCVTKLADLHHVWYKYNDFKETLLSYYRLRVPMLLKERK